MRLLISDSWDLIGIQYLHVTLVQNVAVLVRTDFIRADLWRIAILKGHRVFNTLIIKDISHIFIKQVVVALLLFNVLLAKGFLGVIFGVADTLAWLVWVFLGLLKTFILVLDVFLAKVGVLALWIFNLIILNLDFALFVIKNDWRLAFVWEMTFAFFVW